MEQSTLSYAQHSEDRYLHYLFYNVLKLESTGFFVDVGAFHPVQLSNTFLFYQKGWSGINIDARPGSMALFNEQRPKDINLELAISDTKETLTYYQIDSMPGCNSFSLDMLKETHMLDKVSSQAKIQTFTLEEVLDRYLPDNTSIDLLTVDVEGLDHKVLLSNNWEKYRPTVIVVELQIKDRTKIAGNETVQFLQNLGYEYLDANHIRYGVGSFFFMDKAALKKVNPGTGQKMETPKEEQPEEEQLKEQVKASKKTSWPMVSCVMPTFNRHYFVWKSIQYFQNQTYPNKELIIIDDSHAEYDRLPDDSRIRYYHIGRKTSIGSKRNMGCQWAKGDIIIQWDDDDFYSIHRIRKQVMALIQHKAHICSLFNLGFFDVRHFCVWECNEHLQRRFAFPTLNGGHTSTLAYWKALWERGCRYPDSSFAEEYAFLKRALAKRYKYHIVDNEGDFLCLRHTGNTWRNIFSHAHRQIKNQHNWKATAPEKYITKNDLPFYREYYKHLSKAAQSMATEGANNNKFLFILAPPYSGSTLLHEIISTSPNVSPNNTDGTREGQTLPIVGDIMFLENRWLHHVDYDWAFIKHIWMQHWDASKPVLLEKSPPNMIRTRSIIKHFHPIYFVILHRNPYAHCESLLRRHSITATRAAEFAIFCLYHQWKNSNELRNAVTISYEEMVNNPDSLVHKIQRILPEVTAIHYKQEFAAHNFKNRQLPVVDLNEEKIANIKPEDLRAINTVFRKNKWLLFHFRYPFVKA
ncbi:MAG: glycosyltransferase [Chitinophagales bacterium]|nr:glycosyltransferase [Chitinophagales bacterium]